MEWTIDKSKPICPQIVNQICLRVASGEIQPGEKLLSVREIALLAGVNPNTVQKSFEQLEAMDVLHSVRGSGWYVNEDSRSAVQKGEAYAMEAVRKLFDDLMVLGFDAQKVKQMVEEYANE